MPIDRVLIANRGEIAVRIAGTLRRLGIESVAVHAPADADAPHVRACDHAVPLVADGERSPYLDIAQLVAIAGLTGSDAVHPGYGFLAERADAAAAFRDAGVTWIGPSPEAIELLGDKIASKRTAAEAEVPVVPGLSGPPTQDVDADQITAFAAEVGLPLLLKASAGGGGKGMRRVDDAAAIPAAVEAARREAQAAFGRSELLVERLVEPARHVEVQVAVDAHGGAWAIGERECSLQRRHQKLIEESPAPGLSDAGRAALHEAAIRLAVAAGYRNLGTVEFLVDAADDGGVERFYFLEMNARLQVEHPVTELVHRLDLVELQLRIADGEALDLDLDLDLDLASDAGHGPRGHAIEARICAERIAVKATPSAGGGDQADTLTIQFLPATGPVAAYAEPTGVGVRVDSGITAGSVVTTAFDPMLLKVIAYGRDREQARERLDRALAELVVLGVETNASFLRRLLDRSEFREGVQTTTLVERLLADPVTAPGLAAPTAEAVAGAARAAAVWRHHELTGGSDGTAFGIRDGWRQSRSSATQLRLLDPDEATTTLTARVVADGLEVAVDATEPVVERPEAVRARWRAARTGEWLWLHGPGGTWSWRDAPETAAASAAGSGGLAAPLPGVVIAVVAAPGTRVAAGAAVLVVESMKMELEITAPHDGVVEAVHVAVGEHVERGQVLAAVEQDRETA